MDMPEFTVLSHESVGSGAFLMAYGAYELAVTKLYALGFAADIGPSSEALRVVCGVMCVLHVHSPTACRIRYRSLLASTASLLALRATSSMLRRLA